VRAAGQSRFAVGAALAFLASACSCGRLPATTVTFKVKNKLTWPVFVHDEFNHLGTIVQKDDSGVWTDLREFAACACEECAEACGRCTCFGESSIARRIGPGESLERTWSGEFREQDQTTCLGGKVPCVGSRLPAQPGHYRVKVCYASSLSVAPTGKDRFPADFPSSALTCSHREFELPASGPVEVATIEPPGCRATSECEKGQLCQQGHCSSGCLPHAVPPLGGDWTVEVGGIDDRGFFEVTADPKTQAKTYLGTGKVSSVRFSSGTTNLTLIRYDAIGIDYTATFYYTLPGKRAVPFAVGDALEVVLVEFPAGDRKLARGLTLRQGGALLLAADNGRGGPVLSAQQIAPFEVSVDGESFACMGGDCGRRVHRKVTFRAGEKRETVEPGKTALFNVGAASFDAVAVGNYRDEVQGCGTSPSAPYVFMQKRDVQTP
jgi:hypothetical protein